jgi:glycolate oxidase iron-sulfur subunit
LPSPRREVRARVVYQDACHLAQAQRIRSQPRRLLQAVPGLELAEMAHPDICCGAAGLYSTLEPEMSRRILAEKLDDLLSAGPQMVVTANPGCQMQLQAGLRARGQAEIPVLHVAELLAQAYS